MIVVLATTVGAACGPWCGGQGTVPSYAITQKCQGTISAPAAFGVPANIPADCGAMGEPATPDDFNCLPNPAKCSQYSFSAKAPGPFRPGDQIQPMLDVGITLVPPLAAGTVTLPSDNVTVGGFLQLFPGGGNLSFESGTISAQLTQDHLDVHYSVTFVTSGGDQITVSNGHYQASGEATTVCHAD